MQFLKQLPSVLAKRLVCNQLRRRAPELSRYYSSDSPKLPGDSQVVICGGGIIGCSVAYHLAKLGWTDIVLLEQGSISGGTTWHAAGLINPLKGGINDTKLSQYAIELFPKLEQDTDTSTGWKECGAVLVARTKDRMISYKRTAVMARICGLDTELLSARECYEKCPIIRYDDLQGGIWVPACGSVAPSDLCNAFRKGASKRGVKIVEKVAVDKVLVSNNRVCGVRTNKGDIKCEVFVNCAGQWARDLGKRSDPPVRIPLHSVEHYYIVTKPLKEEVDSMLPTLRDLDGHIYVREWSGGIMAGGFEPISKPIFSDGVPSSFEFQLLPEDWDHFQILMDEMMHRVPALQEAEIRQMVNGAESFTPDAHPMLGEAPEVKNYYVAAGFNSSGILGSSGAGLVLSEWIVNGYPHLDVWSSDITRFGQHNLNKNFLYQRSVEIVGRRYQIAYPKMEYNRARDVKHSPLYSMVDEAGASWGAKMGWERPNWFTRSPDECKEFKGTFGRPHWFDSVREEHINCRNKVCVFDMTSFAKFEVEGDGVVESMQVLCANNVDVPVGKVVYTGMLNDRGGYETDCTVTRTATDKYLIVCPTAQATHDAVWISKHLPSSVQLRDVTSQYTVLAVMGPQSRLLLEQVTDHPLDNHNFPFGTSQVIEIGFAPSVRASRISYVGELGWELYIPNEYASDVYNRLFSDDHNVLPYNAGYYALDSLRVEKAYRHWGGELDTNTTPWEAGLGFAVDMKKNIDFNGKKALIDQKQNGLYRRVAIFTLQELDDDNFMWSGEAIIRNDKIVGYITSSAYGYSIGRPVGMGLINNPSGAVIDQRRLPVDNDYILNADYHINIAGVLYPAIVSLSPPYDPKSLRVHM